MARACGRGHGLPLVAQVQCWPAQCWPPPCSPPPSSPNYCHTCGNTAGTSVSHGSAINNNGYLIYQAERPLSRTELRAFDTARGEVARSLWVPITYATRRYSLNDASGAIAPPEAEVVQVGDAIGQRAKRRGLVQGAVRPVSVAEVLVLA